MFDLLQFIVERWPYDVSATGLMEIENQNFQITEQAYLDFSVARGKLLTFGNG